MLDRLVRDLLTRRKREPEIPEPPAIARMRRNAAAHSRAPRDAHLDVLFSEARVGDRRLLDIVAESARRTDTIMAPLKVFHRHYAMQALVNYFLRAGRLAGRRGECGVFTGLSSRVMCEAARALDPAFDGSGFHMVDSFEGLSAPQAEDFQPVNGPDGSDVMVPPMIAADHFRVDYARVQASFADFPGARFHKGWIPEALELLPDDRWSFVHLDVDMYAPTLACLKYFVPRLVPGGVVICDDYGAPTFPGAARAWLEYCDAQDLPFVVLPTGQSILVKDD